MLLVTFCILQFTLSQHTLNPACLQSIHSYTPTHTHTTPKTPQSSLKVAVYVTSLHSPMTVEDV